MTWGISWRRFAASMGAGAGCFQWLCSLGSSTSKGQGHVIHWPIHKTVLQCAHVLVLDNHWVLSGVWICVCFSCGLYQASILTVKPWVGVGSLLSCLPQYVITNGPTGSENALVFVDEILFLLGQKYAINLTFILTKYGQFEPWAKTGWCCLARISYHPYFLWEREYFQGCMAETVLGDLTRPLEVRAVRQGCINFYLHLYFTDTSFRALLIPFCQGKPSQPPPKTLKELSSCVVLSPSWRSRGFQVINCKPSRCCELWHKQCEQPETHPGFL